MLYLVHKEIHDEIHAKEAEAAAGVKMASAMGMPSEIISLMKKTMHSMMAAMEAEVDAKIGYAYVVETKKVLSKADLSSPHIEAFITGPCTVIFVPNTVRAFAVEAGEIGTAEAIDIKNPN